MKGKMLKTVVLSAAGGAVVWWILLGAVWGWMTPGRAERMAEERADAAVIEALTPVCVAKFEQTVSGDQKLSSGGQVETVG